jgi:hypothetical protein
MSLSVVIVMVILAIKKWAMTEIKGISSLPFFTGNRNADILIRCELSQSTAFPACLEHVTKYSKTQAQV